MTIPLSQTRWSDLVWPREHGSWSLALEPVVFGLLAAPSLPGIGLAAAVAAGFLARRPLRIAAVDAKPVRRAVARRVTAILSASALAGLGWSIIAGPAAAWLLWLLPSAVAGSVFLWLDLKQSGREQAAEIAGAFAFAWLPAAFATLAGLPAAAAAALGLVMLARTVPTVVTVRATLRARKTGQRQILVPLAAAVTALAVVAALARAELAPAMALAFCTLFVVRTFVLLLYPRPALRASTVGIIEAILGVGYVVAVALSWSAYGTSFH